MLQLHIIISTLFYDLVYYLNFIQHINTATHIQGNILDVILANIDDDDSISNVIVYPHNNQPIKSDHFLISFEICHGAHCQPHNSPNYVFNYSKVDYTGLCQYLFTSNIYLCFQIDDVETVWTIINETLLKAIDFFVPKEPSNTLNDSTHNLFMKRTILLR